MDLQFVLVCAGVILLFALSLTLFALYFKWTKPVGKGMKLIICYCIETFSMIAFLPFVWHMYGMTAALLVSVVLYLVPAIAIYVRKEQNNENAI